jgi:hypothetical protein
MATAKDPVIPTPAPTPEYTSEDARKDKMTEEFMRDYYSKQEKVSVKCSEDQWVQVNGYTFVIKKGERVMVPKDIFDILDAGGRI